MAATCPLDFDTARLRDHVHAVYSRLADDPSGSFHFHRGTRYAVETLGYEPEQLARVPEVARARFAGVGNPLAAGPLPLGGVVLDHACGAGTDLILAALRVGPLGRAIGVDMTPAMRERAREAIALAGLAERVEVREGLLEALPVADASVDVVVSNGVLNLSPDKRRALSEIARVLKPGGRLYLADVVVQRELSTRARRDPELWAACVAGALPEPELHELAAEAGLLEGRVVARFESFAGASAAAKVSPELELGAVSFSARKSV